MPDDGKTCQIIFPVMDGDGWHVDDKECGKPAVMIVHRDTLICRECVIHYWEDEVLSPEEALLVEVMAS